MAIKKKGKKICLVSEQPLLLPPTPSAMHPQYLSDFFPTENRGVGSSRCLPASSAGKVGAGFQIPPGQERSLAGTQGGSEGRLLRPG